MGIPVRKFLNKYYDPNDLGYILENIGEPVGRTKKERIERIIENWQSYNRDWYDILDYLDWETLTNICDDFDIYYADYWKEETLCKKIEDARVLDYRKETMKKFENIKYSSKQNNSQYPFSERISGSTRGKLNRIIICSMIIWFIVGITMSILALDGYFIQESIQPISVSKEYLVSIETSNNQGIRATSEGLKGFVTLNGDILLKSTLFSAQNKINISSELHPDNGFEGYEDRVIDTLPEPYWIIIPDAKNIVGDETVERNFAIINLTKSFDPPKIAGSGDVVFTKGGNNVLFLVDPQELDKVSSILNSYDSHHLTFTYNLSKSIPSGSNVTNIAYLEEDGSMRIAYEEFSILTSDTISYPLNIKTADSLRTLETSKETTFGIWMASTFSPIGIGVAFLFRKH